MKRSWFKLCYAFVLLLLLHMNHPSLGFNTSGVGNIRCIERERQALLAFKQGVVGTENLLLSWGTQPRNRDCCTWEGVHCSNHTGHVIELDLAEQYLQGTISPKLVELQHLKLLNLSHNNFSQGDISKFNIGSLRNLRYLDLSLANVVGKFPLHQLANLTHLKYLDLGGNFLANPVESLNWLPYLSSLQYLDLSSIDLRSVFNWLKAVNELPQLRDLYLDGCGLHGPSILFGTLSDINSSKFLSHVGLSSNHIRSSSIFQWLFNYNNTGLSLVHIDLSSNSLSGSIPDVLANMNSLAYLDLSFNSLSGSIPDVSTNMSSLVYLNLSFNSLSGSIPDVSTNMNSLAYLDLSFNSLSGSIPDVSTNMSSLAFIDLSTNQLGGQIPRSFVKLCNLQSLIIENNNLSGQFSEVVKISSTCAQNSLESLYLSDNHLFGSLPNLTNFTSLTELYLSNNRLSGRIPESIGQLSNLRGLYLGMNSLDGFISETHFSNLSNLKFLDLSFNPLVLNFHSDWVPPFQLYTIFLGSCKVGPHFPKWLQTQKYYSFLDISNAGISDILPTWFWDLSREADCINLSHNKIRGTFENLTLNFGDPPWLNLSSNQLEGSIPSFLLYASALDLSNNKISGSVPFLCTTTNKKLMFLDLSSNNISGVLPNCWTHVENLVVLDLSNNILHGEIPATMGSLHQINTLKLNGNRLVGELPSSLKNCRELRVLDLGYNELSGPLPKWLGPAGTHNLVILMLQSNHFNGSMPSQLCNLPYIHILDLSMNNISGTIPKCLNNLVSLAQNGDQAPPSRPLPQRSLEKGPSFEYGYKNYASFIWKGRMYTFKSILWLVKRLDLSSNKLSGEIPSEIVHLVGLVSLNLSRNSLTGQITPEIGKLQSLEALDLSSNHIYGRIPTSLSQIYSLAVLDLSNNSLFGKIPIGRQLQTLDPSGFEGNPQLCGLPLKKLCPSEQTRPDQRVIVDEESTDGLVTQGFYISMGLGFFVGFWGVFGPLLVNKSWRYTYFNILNDFNDWIYVRIALIRRPRMSTS